MGDNEKYILAFGAAFAFMSLLVVMGMPTGYQFMGAFDFVWLGGGLVTVTAACVVITGVPCAAAEAIFGFATLLTYIGIPVITSGTVGAEAVIRAVIMTPLSLLLIYIISKLARGGG